MPNRVSIDNQIMKITFFISLIVFTALQRWEAPANCVGNEVAHADRQVTCYL